MIKNYLVVAFRNLMHHKFYSLLNVVGLAAGIACALLAVLYVDYHFRFDRHHEKVDRIYQVMRKVTDAEGTHYDMRTKPLAPVLKATFPEIEHAIRAMVREMWVHHEGQGFTVPVAIASKEIMDVFTIPMLQGDGKTGLDAPNSVFLSQKLAKNLFGDNDPIGKTVTVDYKWIKDDFVVTGIFEDCPETSNTILQFDFLTATFPDKPASRSQSWKGVVWDRWPSNWFVAPLTTYVLLQDGTDAKAFEKKLHPFAAKNQLEGRLEDVDYYLQPLSRVHLYSMRDYATAEKNHGDITRCYTLLGIGLLVLAIACMNYINLVTARSVNRMREVGLRKVVGAARVQIIFQFLGESVLVTLLACGFAALMAQAALPYFNLVLESNLTLSDLSLHVVVGFPLSIVCVVGVLSGSYPAFVLSAFSPVRSLKGALTGGKNRAWFREALVVMQFAASVVLIVGTLVVYKQTEFVRTKDLGFHRERVVVLSFFLQDRKLWDHQEAIKQELTKYANVEGVTACHLLPGEINTTDRVQLNTEDGTVHKLYRTGIDTGYLDVLDMEIVQGASLPSIESHFRQIGENQWEMSILLNETAANMMGWENPVGQVLRFRESRSVIKVVGVVRDFHNRSLHFGIAPQLFEYTRNPKHIVVRIGQGNIVETMSYLEQVWSQFLPSRPFEYQFLNDVFDEYYKAEIRLQKIYAFFAGLSIFLGCLGLLGLVSYAAQQRTKEIGVRKVLGASVSNLVLLLSKNFMALIFVANVLAWPLAYLLASSWLANFTYRIGLSVIPFVITGLVTLLIVFMTVGSQAWRAAHANPVDSLRSE